MENITILYILLFSLTMLSVGSFLALIGGKYLRATYIPILFFSLMWVLYVFYTTETGKSPNFYFNVAGSGCLLQLIGLDITLVMKGIEKAKQINKLINEKEGQKK